MHGNQRRVSVFTDPPASHPLFFCLLSLQATPTWTRCRCWRGPSRWPRLPRTARCRGSSSATRLDEVQILQVARFRGDGYARHECGGLFFTLRFCCRVATRICRGMFVCVGIFTGANHWCAFSGRSYTTGRPDRWVARTEASNRRKVSSFLRRSKMQALNPPPPEPVERPKYVEAVMPYIYFVHVLALHRLTTNIPNHDYIPPPPRCVVFFV